MVALRALKSWQEGQLNLVHGTKNRGKKQKPSTGSSKETVQAIGHEGSPGGRNKATGGSICEMSV